MTRPAPRILPADPTEPVEYRADDTEFLRVPGLPGTLHGTETGLRASTKEPVQEVCLYV
jgi:hypothetical protein